MSVSDSKPEPKSVLISEPVPELESVSISISVSVSKPLSKPVNKPKRRLKRINEDKHKIVPRSNPEQIHGVPNDNGDRPKK